MHIIEILVVQVRLRQLVIILSIRKLFSFFRESINLLCVSLFITRCSLSVEVQTRKQWKRNKEEGIENIKIKISDDLVKECLKLASTGLFSSTNKFPYQLCKGVLDVHKTLMTGCPSKVNFR